jgi:hypothetical protein
MADVWSEEDEKALWAEWKRLADEKKAAAAAGELRACVCVSALHGGRVVSDWLPERRRSAVACLPVAAAARFTVEVEGQVLVTLHGRCLE